MIPIVFGIVGVSDVAVAEQGYEYLQRDLDTSLYPPVEGAKSTTLYAPL
jgi:hypothetical protein